MDTIRAIKTRLIHLENRLQTLVEGSLVKLFSGRSSTTDLARLLSESMQAGVKQTPQGQPIAPNLYLLLAHPNTSAAIQDRPALLEELAGAIQEAGEDLGLVFISPPVVRVTADPEIPPGEVRVSAQISLEELAQTTDMGVGDKEEDVHPPKDAFLIVNGTQAFPLNQAVVNIGRRPDNHLVIDDARISRVHAQLRAIHGHYVIFDLDSTGGTFVNDQPVHHSVLFPGDLVSLAGVPLIYGQDTNGLGETQKYDLPPGSEHANLP